MSNLFSPLICIFTYIYHCIFLSDGRDYIGLPESFSHVLTFTPGETKQFVSISIIGNNVYEGVEEFYGRLTTTDSAVHITYPDATAQITDDDGELFAQIYCY